MSRLTTALTCSLLLAWSTHPAMAVVQETEDTQEREPTSTNTQIEAGNQLPAPQTRQRTPQEPSRPEAVRRQQEAQQPNRNFGQQQSQEQFRQQFDQEPSGQFDERSDERMRAEGRFQAQGQLEAQGSAGQRTDGSMTRQRQAEAGQQLDLGAQSSGSQDTLTVRSVNEGTLAAEIGLQENDEIVSVGGRTVNSADQLNSMLVRTQAERVPIVVRRAGAPTTLYFRPQLLPEPVFVPARRIDPGLGFVLAPQQGDRLVVQEVAGGLADVIGLRENDVIVSVAGRPVTSQEQFVDLLYTTDAEQIPIVIIRDGRRDVLFVREDVLGIRMYDGPDLVVAEDAWLGVVLDAQYEDAAVVRRVVPGSPADDAGVREGDWIVSVNGRRVTSPDHLTWLVDALEPGQRIELDVSRRVSGTLVARLEGQDAYQPRQALRPTYDVYEPGDVQVRQRQFYRGEVVDDFDAVPAPPVTGDRFGPAERGLRDRLDWDNVPDEPRGLLPRR